MIICCSLCAYLAGNVKVGELLYIGIDAIISAGAVVIEDIPDNVTAVGVPARMIKEHSGGG